MEAEDAVRLERRCSIGNGGGVPRAADNGLCYEKMNLNGAEIDFKRCRDSLLKHAEAVKHDWAKKPMSWEYVNEQKLDGFPLARLWSELYCFLVWSHLAIGLGFVMFRVCKQR